MKKIAVFSAMSALVLASPLAALASPMTLHCTVGDFKVAGSMSVGPTRVSFRKETFSEGEALCDRKANAYCSVARKDADVIRLTRTVRGGTTADGEALLSYEYLVDFRNRTVTTNMTDRFGPVFSDSVSVCRADGEPPLPSEHAERDAPPLFTALP